VKLDFIGEWTSQGGPYFRPVKEFGELRVVTELVTGALVTHFFSVRRRPESSSTGGSIETDFVVAQYKENIVYIPERCVDQKRGDHTECYPATCPDVRESLPLHNGLCIMVYTRLEIVAGPDSCIELRVLTDSKERQLVTHIFYAWNTWDGARRFVNPYIPEDSNIVYIPGQCVRRYAGDQTGCAEEFHLTVSAFNKLEFGEETSLGGYKRFSPAREDAKVLMVAEEPAGNLITHDYRGAPSGSASVRDEAEVSDERNMVYMHRHRCAGRMPRDRTGCMRGGSPEYDMLPLDNGTHTVLKYVKVVFLGEWEFSGRSVSFIPLLASKGELQVVVEEPVGELITYEFIVPPQPVIDATGRIPDEVVYAPLTENIIFIPTTCFKRIPGDATECITRAEVLGEEPVAARSQRTLMSFLKATMHGKWEGGEAMFQPSLSPGKGELNVVTEMPSGKEMTHKFIVRRRPYYAPGIFYESDRVLVGDKVILIPELCIERSPGDITGCDATPAPADRDWTVAAFAKVDLHGNWGFAYRGEMSYRALDDEERLEVVSKKSSGNYLTSVFAVKRSETVFMSKYNNLVVVPAKCRDQATGDRTKCKNELPETPVSLIPDSKEVTVLEYIKVEMVGLWDVPRGTHYFLPVEDSGELRVVTEDEEGDVITHYFTVHRRPYRSDGEVLNWDMVFIPDTRNIIYIPERCNERKPGDRTECILM
jgi:hypothetical protein